MKKNSFHEFWNRLKHPDDATLEKMQKISEWTGVGAFAGLVTLEGVNYSIMHRYSYADILKLFEEDKIESYHLNFSTRELRFLRRGEEYPESTIIPNIELFLKDIHNDVKKHNLEEPDDRVKMDYSHGIPNWVYLVLLSGLGLLTLWSDFLNSLPQQGQAPIQIIRDDPPKQQDFGHINAMMDTNRKATFADVAGADEEKAELQEIVEYLKNPEKFTRLGARVPKGVLLIGPPGTGKTLLARAVAGEADVPFFSISGSEFVEMFVGVGAARVRDLFQQARAKSPCIIFIDEIDAIARKRGSDILSGNEERETTLNQLLVEMDGFSSDSGIILIGATNRGDILDPALLRPGRFDRQVHVGYPDIKGRTEILKIHAKGKPLAASVKLEDVAKGTAGFTGADLENLLNEAALLAARADKNEIGQEELREASVKVMMGAEKKSHRMTDKERRLTAFHEAGHAVTNYHLPSLDPVEEVSIIPRGSAGGYTMSLPQEDRSYASRNEMLDELVSLLGGRVAESIVMGDISTGASNDIERATSLARSMITRYGMSEVLGPETYEEDRSYYGTSRNYSEKTAVAIDEEVHSLLNRAYHQAEDLLNQNRSQLDRLADYLLENEKVDGETFRKLMQKNESKPAAPEKTPAGSAL
ncbi:MAG: ATP-dependent zinc metalloprotease FtsH [Oscillospiraceae bacterium]|nr:ATP-dependent zinc metalloprotease FtsH [Oscillospiraceae bacterium]